MTPIEDTVAELAALAPMLGPALRRDNTTTGRFGRLEATLSPVNTDVLSAMITLRHEIPAAAIRATDLVREPWQPRTIGACLAALPRLAERIRHLGMATEHRQLEDAARHWVRITKRALGLRAPDIPLGVTCPACDQGHLTAAGAEGYIRRKLHGDVTVQWVHDPRVYCPACSANWPEPEWDHLIRVIEQQRVGRLSA